MRRVLNPLRKSRFGIQLGLLGLGAVVLALAALTNAYDCVHSGDCLHAHVAADAYVTGATHDSGEAYVAVHSEGHSDVHSQSQCHHNQTDFPSHAAILTSQRQESASLASSIVRHGAFVHGLSPAQSHVVRNEHFPAFNVRRGGRSAFAVIFASNGRLLI